MPQAEQKTSPVGQAREFQQLVVSYAKQETVEPLKATGKTVVWGAIGGLLFGLGAFFAVMATLRGLQTIRVLNDPAQSNSGWLSWVPYLGAIVVAAIIIVVCLKAISARSR